MSSISRNSAELGSIAQSALPLATRAALGETPVFPNAAEHL
ncbi:MAG: hypothetical protein ACK4GG_04275 [Sphingomonas sp.]